MDLVKLCGQRHAGILLTTLAAGLLAASPANAFDRTKTRSKKPLLLEQGFSAPELAVNPSLSTFHGV